MHRNWQLSFQKTESNRGKLGFVKFAWLGSQQTEEGGKISHRALNRLRSRRCVQAACAIRLLSIRALHRSAAHRVTMSQSPPPLSPPESFTSITEGLARVLVPGDDVFYNPVQRFNRDLSVAVIRTFSESLLVTKKQLRKAAWEEKRRKEGTPVETAEPGPEAEAQTSTAPPLERNITILEALSASGLRSIRYALEIPRACTVYANDMSPCAIQVIHRNISHNNLPEHLVQVSQSDANALMYSRRTERVDVIDLDPYGTATPFIDAAVQAIASDGLLCITCTDMAVSAGIGYPEKCFANYGGMPVKQEYTHEVVSSAPIAS